MFGGTLNKTWEFSRLESWSRDPFLHVLVLVLEPSSLGLVPGTWDHEDSVFITHEA